MGMSRPYLEQLNDTASEHNLHIGLRPKGRYWLLFAVRPGSDEIVNELVAKDLHGGLDAAAHILRAWIENDLYKGAKQ